MKKAGQRIMWCRWARQPRMLAVSRPLAPLGTVGVCIALGLTLLPGLSAASSPGGDGEIVLASDVNNLNGGMNSLSKIVSFPSTGGPPAKIAHCLEDNLTGLPDCPTLQDVTFSPDGQTLLWAATGIGGSGSGIVELPADGSGPPHSIIENTDTSYEQPTFAPDDQRIALVRQTSSRNEIVVSDITGTKPTLLTSISGTAPAWSPTGQQIVFVHAKSIWSIKPNGSGGKSIIAVGDDPDFSPDGTKLTYIGAGGAIYLANANGSDPRRLSCMHCGTITRVVFAPDGHRLAFVGLTTVKHEAAAIIATIPLAGGAPTTIVNIGGDSNSAEIDPTGFAWQPLQQASGPSEARR